MGRISMDKAISAARNAAYDKADSNQHEKWSWSCPSCLLVGVGSEIVYEVHIVLEGSHERWSGTFQVDVATSDIVGMHVHARRALENPQFEEAPTEQRSQLSAEEATDKAVTAVRRLTGTSDEETQCVFQSCELLQLHGELIYEVKMKLCRRQTRWNTSWNSGQTELWSGSVDVSAATGQVMGVTSDSE